MSVVLIGNSSGMFMELFGADIGRATGRDTAIIWNAAVPRLQPRRPSLGSSVASQGQPQGPQIRSDAAPLCPAADAAAHRRAPAGTPSSVLLSPDHWSSSNARDLRLTKLRI